MKTDYLLGKKVQYNLVEKGIETPIIRKLNGWLKDAKLKEELEVKFREILELLSLDLNDDSICETPKRLAKMYTNEIFYGLDYENFPKITTIENKMGYDEMVAERGISVKSFCEHHFVIIDGTATIAYIPRKKVIGLSKMNRIVDFFARRPQVQERLTEQIFSTLSLILETPDVAVLLDSTHFCVRHRGIQHDHAKTSTSKLGGAFKEDYSTRSEFMKLMTGN